MSRESTSYERAMAWYSEQGIEPTEEDLQQLEQIRQADHRLREERYCESLSYLGLPKRLQNYIPKISEINETDAGKITGIIGVVHLASPVLTEQKGVQIAAHICANTKASVFWTYAQAAREEYNKNVAFIDRDYRDRLQAEFLFLHTYQQGDLNFEGFRYFLQYRFDAMKTTIFVSPSYDVRPAIEAVMPAVTIKVWG